MDPFKIQRRNSLHLETDGIWDGLENEEDTIVEHRIKLNECMMLRRVLGQDKSDILPKARGVVSFSCACVFWLVYVCALSFSNQLKRALTCTPHPTHHTPHPETQACKMSAQSQHKSFVSRLSHLGDTPDIGTSVVLASCLIPPVPSGHTSRRIPLATPCNNTHSHIHLHLLSHTAGRVSINECHHLSDTLKMVAGGSTFLPGACSAMLKKEEHDLAEKFEDENAKVYARLKRRDSWVGKADYPPTAT